MPDIIRKHSDIVGIALIGLTIVAAYLGSLWGHDHPITGSTLVTLILLGLVMFFGQTAGFNWVQQQNSRFFNFLYFLIGTALLGLILYLLEFRTGWIIALPLAGQAVALRWPTFILAVASNIATQMAIIWILSEDLVIALQSMPSLVVAVLFVVLFTWVTVQTEEKNDEIVTLALKLQEANQQLREYATKAEDLAISKERNRMAREIHDSLGHYLTVVNVQLEAAKAMMGRDQAKAEAAIGKAQQLTQEGLADVRRSVSSLRESPIENRPIPQALADLTAEAEAAGIVVNLSITGKPRPLPANTALTVYRATQEALTNVRKHARASKVDVALHYTPEETVALTVSDNGVGSNINGGGFGLMGIRERVQLLRGHFKITTAEGEGFRLEMSMPG